MNKICTKWEEVSGRIHALWNKTEALIIRFFNTYDVTDPEVETVRDNERDNDKDNNSAPPLPKMTEFNVIVAAIKRLQEARIALLKEEAAYEAHAQAEDPDSGGVQEEISRILKALEKNGAGEGTDQDALPD